MTRGPWWLGWGLALVAPLAPVAILSWSRPVDAAPQFKNLQVLPKEIPKEQLKSVMRAQAKALGVECEHCHAVPDMAADDSAQKKIARQMMKMTAEINAKWLAGTKEIKPPVDQVTCATCHQGHEKPPAP